MKSIKPGRGPSAMGFVGSIGSIVFGIFWTIYAFRITHGFGGGGPMSFFPFFGIIFIGMGIVNAVYNYKNATGKNRFSTFDITEEGEEQDPLDKFVKGEADNEQKFDKSGEVRSSDARFCPYCGAGTEPNHKFCSKCGKEI